ncbi:hypothetical protein CRENBAI_011749 [Crenichthys baileyi]|uniref:Uncharacterized protein n=1 Tax=Crenichthys baileyi TaxID=28760 RepID=A0AAV9S0I6_9TELE
MDSWEWSDWDWLITPTILDRVNIVDPPPPGRNIRIGCSGSWVASAELYQLLGEGILIIPRLVEFSMVPSGDSAVFLEDYNVGLLPFIDLKDKEDSSEDSGIHREDRRFQSRVKFPDGAGVSQVCWVTGATDLLIVLEEYLSRRLPALRCQSVCLLW